jgi:hypothetical protein
MGVSRMGMKGKPFLIFEKLYIVNKVDCVGTALAPNLLEN